jgi:mannose-6-phosphate isomerase-like protein (cupin superfamily)
MSFHLNLDEATRTNSFFRKELYTTDRTQIVVMSVEPGDDIGLETHDLDQVLYFVSGKGEYSVGDDRGKIQPGDVVVVPAHTQHNFLNTGNEPMKLFTVYAPPDHAPGTLHRTKAEAMEAEAAEHAQPRVAPGM